MQSAFFLKLKNVLLFKPLEISKNKWLSGLKYLQRYTGKCFTKF